MYLLLLVEICEYRKTPFASELGTPHNDGFTGCDGNVQVSWIRLTNLSKQRGCKKTHRDHRVQTTKRYYTRESHSSSEKLAVDKSAPPAGQLWTCFTQCHN